MSLVFYKKYDYWYFVNKVILKNEKIKYIWRKETDYRDKEKRKKVDFLDKEPWMYAEIPLTINKKIQSKKEINILNRIKRKLGKLEAKVLIKDIKIKPEKEDILCLFRAEFYEKHKGSLY
jgi:hypothetical protein